MPAETEKQRLAGGSSPIHQPRSLTREYENCDGSAQSLPSAGGEGWGEDGPLFKLTFGLDFARVCSEAGTAGIAPHCPFLH